MRASSRNRTEYIELTVAAIQFQYDKDISAGGVVYLLQLFRMYVQFPTLPITTLHTIFSFDSSKGSVCSMEYLMGAFRYLRWNTQFFTKHKKLSITQPKFYENTKRAL